jgi:hypothetical protein
MEESLIGKGPEREIKIPGPGEIDSGDWNLCGGVFLVGCWLGFCMVPLIQIIKKNRDEGKKY